MAGSVGGLVPNFGYGPPQDGFSHHIMGVEPHVVENSRDLDDCSVNDSGEELPKHIIGGVSNVDENEQTQKGLLQPESSNVNYPTSCPSKKRS